MCSVVKHDERQPAFPARMHRRGLTTLEFVSCFIAVIGGAWLGALYLGIDVRHVAHTALAEADLLDKVPPQWRPSGPTDSPMTREQLVTTLRKELGTLRSEIVALRSSGGNTGETAESSDAHDSVKHRTLTYWMRLSEIALGETSLQQDAQTAFDDANAAKVFAVKGRVSRFAAKAVEAVPKDLVDAAVVQFGEQLGAWYSRTAELYDRAVQIWEMPAANKARTQLNKEWRAAEMQHRSEARLLYERAATLRSAISRQFGEEFPEFAQPAAPPASNPADSTAS